MASSYVLFLHPWCFESTLISCGFPQTCQLYVWYFNQMLVLDEDELIVALDADSKDWCNFWGIQAER